MRNHDSIPLVPLCVKVTEMRQDGGVPSVLKLMETRHGDGVPSVLYKITVQLRETRQGDGVLSLPLKVKVKPTVRERRNKMKGPHCLLWISSTGGGGGGEGGGYTEVTCL